MELSQIRRSVLALLMTTATVAYIQLLSMERWSNFWHVRFRSPVVYEAPILDAKFLHAQPTPDINLMYFDVDVETSEIDKKTQGLDPAHVVINSGVVVHGSSRNKSIVTNTMKNKNRFAPLLLQRFILNQTDFSEKPLMLLFTSWEYNQEKAPVHSTLQRLWTQWPGVIKPMVMTRDKLVQRQVKDAGWLFQTVTALDKECHGPPILANMFTDVFKKHDAYFYGYSNADIVYGDGLRKTLEYIYYNFKSWKTRPVMIVGRRHNVDFTKFGNRMNTSEQVRAVTKYGQLVIRSTDYFFTNRHFPWGQAPKVSIGKVWVVRAIIGWALKHGYVVIDATRTIEAVHLTTKDGVFASWHKPGAMCNERVLASLHWSIPTAIGHCECARLETYHGANKDIRIRHRPPDRKLCTHQVREPDIRA